MVIDPRWEPSYNYIVEADRNRRPGRLPVYEHHVDRTGAMLVLPPDLLV